MELAEAVRGLFAPARRPGRVGAEVELIPVTDTDPPRAVDPAVMAGGFDAGFIASGRPTFEPGGQLELSPPPCGTVAGLVEELHRLLAWAAAQLAPGRVTTAGALGPVDAFGVEALEAACREAGLGRD